MINNSQFSPAVRETASVIFTNFVRMRQMGSIVQLSDNVNKDMLHASILPHEELWRT